MVPTVNALDFGIIVVLAMFFFMRSNMSFVYLLLGSGGWFTGYFLGTALAPVAVNHVSSELKKGIVSLILIFGLALLLGLVGLLVGRKLKMKVIVSRFSAVDRLLAWPYKIFTAILGIILLSQTLVYVPVLGLQFEAQGSTLLMSANKLSPSTPLENLARKISPYQFRKLHLAYDPDPLTYNNIKGAGEFQSVVDSVADSVVKISGINCVNRGFGSGFVAAPNIVVTNAHVISGASSVYISDHEGVYPATPLVIDNSYDIAVLYSRFIGTEPIALSASRTSPGDKGISLGYPRGGDLRMAQGVVTGRAYRSSHNKLGASNTLTLSATLGEGSSGGPTLNLNGEVIGVNDAGGNGELIIIRPEVVRGLVDKAKSKLFPASTEFCAVPSKSY